MSNLLAKGRELRKSQFAVDIEENINSYQVYKQKIPALRDLAQTPFTFKMILMNFSSIRETIEQHQGSAYEINKADIYRVFVNNYYYNELLRVGKLEKFSRLL